jgi:hypothetical protein
VAAAAAANLLLGLHDLYLRDQRAGTRRWQAGRFDPNIEDELQRFSGEGRTSAQWLRAWLDGQDLWPLEASEADEEAELGWWQQRLGPPWGQGRLFR